MTATIASIGELPFHERPAHELLALDRDEPDPDYAGYGWARLPEVWLESPAGSALVRDALVVAIHSADDAEPLAGDVDLEFAVGDAAFAVRLSAFLDRWLPRLPADGALVLAMCNYHDAAIGSRGDRPLWYPLGAVAAWLDVDSGRIRLVADGWRQA